MLKLLVHILGIDDPSGSWYLFWSGIGGDFTELAIVGGAASFYKAHSCDIKGCYRIARTEVKGTEWTVCRHHATSPRPTVADLARTYDVESLPADVKDKLDD